MTRQLNSVVVAAYVALAVVIGGSAQNPWTNLALQLLGIALIAWVAIAPARVEPGSRPTLLYALLLAALLVVLVQLVPLPPDIWADLPGREPIVRGYDQLGHPVPAFPTSLTPYASVMTVFAAIPGIAAFIGAQRLEPSPRLYAVAVVVVTVAAVILGAQQIAAGPGSWAYFYRFTNPGAVGFFANQNHMAMLLLVSIPLAAALFGSAKAEQKYSAGGRLFLGSAFLLLVLIGVVLNGSLAALALVVPVLLASAFILPAAARWRRVAFPVTIAALVAGVALVATRPIVPAWLQSDVAISVSGRVEMWRKTVDAIENTFPVGTGLGSFENVYRLHEDPYAVTDEYVNHVHNDYLEIVLELGAAGLILTVLFLGWWGWTAFRIWTSPLSTLFARAATVVSAIVLAHSIVEYPLRTAAISTIFGVAIALMAQRFGRAPGEAEGKGRAARHMTLD